MNLREFIKIVSTWENYTENFRLFRVWAENCYIRYEKEMNISYCEEERCFSTEEEFFCSEAFKSLCYDWKYIGYDSMVNLYNRMGWPLDEKFKEKKISYDVESDCLYYDISFSEVYERIQKLENDIEFTYALLLLCQNIYHTSKIYKTIVCYIFKGLEEYDLKECLKLLDDCKIKKVFVAMWFDESMKDVRKKIEKAISDCGYKPMLIDVKQHNGQIVPEIFKEIEDSIFVIADLTGQRGGVYYEAGYAMAKGKPVILCCKHAEITHFDVAQINTIYWEDEDDLYERLQKRIRATIGENI